MSGKLMTVALVVALGGLVLAGEAPEPEAPPTPEAPVPEEPGRFDLLDQLKHVEAGPVVFKFGGEARFRYEYWDGYDIDEYMPTATPVTASPLHVPTDARGGDTDGFVLSRIRLNVEAQVTEQFLIFIEGMDSREAGYDDGQFNPFPVFYPGHAHDPYVDRMDLHQAYAQISTPGGLPVIFKLGRQEVTLGGGRLQGKQNWRQTPQTFDAAVMLIPIQDLVTIAAWGGKANLFPDNRSWDHVLSQYDYYGLYTMWQVPGIDAFDVYYKHLRDDRNPAAVLFPAAGDQDIKINAVGVRLQDTVAETIHYGFEVVGEFGEVGPMSLQAFAAHTELGYTFVNMPWSPTVMAEYNFATGDKNGLIGDGQLNTFFPWFPDYHGKFGIMDMFQWSNVEHYKLSATMRPSERMTIQVAGHIFYLDESADRWFAGRTYTPAPFVGSAIQGRTPAAGASNHVGEEIDVVIGYDISENCSVEAGYAHFFSEGFIEQTGRDGGADFGYIMSTFRF
ncbi:MAG: alginate export family protein [Planctomycetota bacterium]